MDNVHQRTTTIKFNREGSYRIDLLVFASYRAVSCCTVLSYASLCRGILSWCGWVPPCGGARETRCRACQVGPLVSQRQAVGLSSQQLSTETEHRNATCTDLVTCHGIKYRTFSTNLMIIISSC